MLKLLKNSVILISGLWITESDDGQRHKSGSWKLGLSASLGVLLSCLAFAFWFCLPIVNAWRALKLQIYNEQDVSPDIYTKLTNLVSSSRHLYWKVFITFTSFFWRGTVVWTNGFCAMLWTRAQASMFAGFKHTSIFAGRLISSCQSTKISKIKKCSSNYPNWPDKIFKKQYLHLPSNWFSFLSALQGGVLIRMFFPLLRTVTCPL